MKLRVGQKICADGKIDLSLTSIGYEKICGIAKTILNILAKNNSFGPITAKTSPEEIFDLFGVSKKKAAGALYKKYLVLIGPDGVRAGGVGDEGVVC